MLVLVACGAERPTELVLVVDAQLDIPAELDELVVVVDGPEGSPERAGRSLDDRDALPTSLGILRGGGPVGPIEISIFGFVEGRQVITREVSTEFVEGERRLVYVVLSRECYRRPPCPAGQTCDGGACVSSWTAGRDLPVFDELPAPVARADTSVDDSSLEDACVDAGAVDGCDGIDGDCDGMIDEDDDCPDGTACEGGICVSECGVCPDDQVCVDADGTPMCIVPLPLGDTCGADWQCLSELCASGVFVGVSSERLCVSACCSDDDCPGGAVCSPGPTGARSCLPPSLAGRGDLGTRAAGLRCASSDECRSGLCGAASMCLGLCGSDDDCSVASTICRREVELGSDPFFAACGPALGTRATDTLCGMEPCATGYCTGVRCAGTCRSSGDCTRGACAPGGGAQICGRTNGAGELGEDCMEDGDCRELGCIDGRCAALCCTSEDCDSDSKCEPTPNGMAVEMRCRLPDPTP